MRACAQAIVDSECQVEYAGKIPTPALISHAIAKHSAGVMVTGSHIPFDRNGIKINKSVGEVLKSDEAGILREVERVRAEEYSRSATASPFDACGMLKRPPELPRSMALPKKPTCAAMWTASPRRTLRHAACRLSAFRCWPRHPAAHSA